MYKPWKNGHLEGVVKQPDPWGTKTNPGYLPLTSTGSPPILQVGYCIFNCHSKHEIQFLAKVWYLFLSPIARSVTQAVQSKCWISFSKWLYKLLGLSHRKTGCRSSWPAAICEASFSLLSEMLPNVRVLKVDANCNAKSYPLWQARPMGRKENRCQWSTKNVQDEHSIKTWLLKNPQLT